MTWRCLSELFGSFKRRMTAQHKSLWIAISAMERCISKIPGRPTVSHLARLLLRKRALRRIPLRCLPRQMKLTRRRVMEPLAAAARTANVERLAREQFDVLVIGGGITGAGVALDAAARGYIVALVEKVDFASGTSSKSTKLAHGGIRYLPQFDFAMIHEGVVERGLMVRHAPFLVRPQAFVIPVYAQMRWPSSLPVRPPTDFGLAFVLDIGLWMYDLMAGRLNIGRHKRISARETLRRAPKLRSQGLKKALLYYDAQTNDAQLTVSVLRTAAQFGAVVPNYTQVTGFTRANGKLNGAGVFAERVAALTGDESKATIEPSKGIHLVVARERVNISTTAVVLPETDDGRILYVIPWEARAIIGTTDTGTGDLDDPQASPADIAYLLKHVNDYLEVNLTHDDILSVYAGYRPLVKSRGARAADLSRTHVVLQENNGMVTIVGGKLTTYRRMAQDTVDVLSHTRWHAYLPSHPELAADRGDR